MDRRDFLTLLGRGALVAAIPIPVQTIINNLGQVVEETKIFAEFFDFDREIGVGVEYIMNGERYRHVVGIQTSDLDHFENISQLITDIMNEHIGSNAVNYIEVDKALNKLKA